MRKACTKSWDWPGIDGWLYATQRGEVSRLKDDDGDGRADLFETVSDGWEINGDYHEYAFGSKFDRDGNLWVVLCLTGSFSSEVKFRGWCLRISPDGKVTPTVSGLRSPGGIGANAAGDMFYTDNQGPWNGTCSLKHLDPGKFVGHPAGNRWYELAPNMGPRPQEPKSGSRMMVEAAQIPELVPPAVYFPYQKMGQSASGIACDTTEGRFGPFAGQMFVGDQTHSTVMRVCLEKVQGPLPGRVHPLQVGIRLGQSGIADVARGAAVRRRNESRLGLARSEAFRPRTTRLDRQDAVRDSRDARAARRLRTHVHATRRSADGRRRRLLPPGDVHVHLPRELRQSRSRSHDAEDRARKSTHRGAACVWWSTSCNPATCTNCMSTACGIATSNRSCTRSPTTR